MRNIPDFTTENGIASLTLSEIPYSKTAYIRIHDSLNPQELLRESCDFCKAIDAERVLATGHAYLEKYPVHTKIIRMCRLRDGLDETDAALFPVRENTIEKWRTLYNEKMRFVDNSAYMTDAKAREFLDRGNAYFVHRDGVLLGFGAASGETIEALGAVIPGMGETVLLALNHALAGERICVEVATTNTRAIRLYQRLGFVSVEELSTWYKIF